MHEEAAMSLCVRRSVISTFAWNLAHFLPHTHTHMRTKINLIMHLFTTLDISLKALFIHYIQTAMVYNNL